LQFYNLGFRFRSVLADNVIRNRVAILAAPFILGHELCGSSAAFCIFLTDYALQADPPIALLEDAYQQTLFSQVEAAALGVPEKLSDGFHPVQDVIR
jgi:hypothetical protein